MRSGFHNRVLWLPSFTLTKPAVNPAVLTAPAVTAASATLSTTSIRQFKASSLSPRLQASMPWKTVLINWAPVTASNTSPTTGINDAAKNNKVLPISR